MQQTVDEIKNLQLQQSMFEKEMKAKVAAADEEARKKTEKLSKMTIKLKYLQIFNNQTK